MTEQFERDDIIEYGTQRRRHRVVAQDGEWLWIRNLASSKEASPLTGVASAAKKVAPFFETGRLYQRNLDFSIRAQARDVTEHFRVVSVEENRPRGGMVAFGSVTFGTVKGIATQWEIMGNYDWVNGGWVAVGVAE
ncbi:hypothetical protein ACWD2L_06040 [Streptomyces sp. NPDC002754]